MARKIGGAPQIETMRCDLRDALLEIIKTQQKPFAKLSKSEQSAVIHRCERAAADLVALAVPLIRSAGHAHFVCRVEKVSIDDKGAKLTIGGVSSVTGAHLDATRLQGRVVVLTEADAQPFMGQRVEQVPQEDQLGLAIERAVTADTDTD